MIAEDMKKLCILGCGGFIGSHILDRLLTVPGWKVIGIDRSSAKISRYMGNPRFSYVNIDIHDSSAIKPYIEQCDAVISLVALCNPSLYNTIPIDVIDANFIRPLEVVKLCADLDKWLIHFSTCEVYGKTAGAITGNPDDVKPFNEDDSPLILGPINAQRWSYAAAKQLLERAIYAYGFERKLRYTMVRPFNFIGPRMDFIPGIDGNGIPRVLACFMDALLFN
jgi:UDP-apiose/xylose synthase